VPLLVLTADRPPELRDCASGQTIDQQRLFGHFPTWYAELAVPEASLGQLAYLRQSLVAAWGNALRPGPVHLNCPWRDPLAPVADGTAEPLRDSLDDRFFAAVPAFSAPALSTAAPSDLPLERWRQCDRGLIIAGPAQPLDPLAYCEAVAHLAQYLGWPVLAEGLSPLRNYARLNPHLVTTYENLLQHADRDDLVPDQVIQLGPLPTSKTLRQWLHATAPQRWVIDPLGANLDPLHGPTVTLPVAVEALAAAIAPGAEPAAPPPSTYLKTWLSADQAARHALDAALAKLDEPFEGKIPWLLAQHLPAHTPLVIANSMPIRDVEWFWPPGDRAIAPYCNRGANGIDGTLSTALGIAHGGPPTVLLTGDLALLHDTSGWLSVPRLRGHLTVIVINNRGGGIFERLPIAAIADPDQPTPGQPDSSQPTPGALETNLFETFFATPQTVDLNRLCAAYGVNYERVETWGQLVSGIGYLPDRGVRVLEVRCDRKQSHALRQTLLVG
jgi:2-succinyl-5-enolpyruvyl-6-hydroxy-3-cyclohexene-1-carboxylate synthase